MTNNNKKNVKPIGFNLTESTKVRLYKIADFFKCKRTDVVKKIFEILFERPADDQAFIAYGEACDKTRSLNSGDKIVYTSFLISGDYMK